MTHREMDMPRLHRLRAAALALSIAFALCLLNPSPAAAAGGGYIRLAHLVPDKIACDMYLQLNSVTGTVVKKLPGIGYGTVSDYEMVPTGTYAVSMRKPGDPASTPPVLSTSVTVAEGRAYTVARIGAPGRAEARVIDDDRTLPSGNQAKVRVVQAAQRTLDVTVADGNPIAKGVAFATATGYEGVAPGARTLKVQPAGGPATTVRAEVVPGSVYSLLVLEGANGTLTAALRTDATRDGPVPKGGVETGAGGAQPHSPVVPLLLVIVVVAAAGLIVARRS